MSYSNSSIAFTNSSTTAVRTMKDRTQKPQHLPNFQQFAQGTVGRIHMPTKRIMASTFPSTLFSQAAKVSSVIPKINYIKNLLLQVQITVASAPVSLVSTCYWFRQKDLREASTGTVIQSHYDDTSCANLFNRVSAGREKAIFKTANIESDAIGKLGLAKPLPVGVHTFYIPIMSSVFENFDGLWLEEMEGDLVLDLTTPSTIIASGAGTISASINFMVEGSFINDSDASIYRNRYKKVSTECHFLEPQRTEFLNFTLTAGSSNNNLRLSNVDGLCGYQMLIVRPTGTAGNNAGFASWKMLNLGDANGAGLDLVSSSGESRWGLGSFVPTRHIRQHQSIDEFDSDWVSQKPVYFLNYSESMNAALRGKVDGGYRFKGSDGDNIRISLPSAPVNEVQTIQFSGVVAVGGFYCFNFRGEQSAQIVATSPAGVIKTTIENMRGVASKFLTVSASAAASSGSITLTITDPEGTLDGDLFTVTCHDAIAVSAATTRTTAGVPGIATGQYDIFVYSYLYNMATYNNNKLRSQLLLV